MSSPSPPYRSHPRSPSSSVSHRRHAHKSSLKERSLKKANSIVAPDEPATPISNTLDASAVLDISKYLLAHSTKVTQENIKTLSSFILHNKSQHERVVNGWLLAYKVCAAPQQIALCYAVNEVLQTCKRKDADVFKKTFPVAFEHALCIVRDYACFSSLNRLLNIWNDRGTLPTEIILGMRTTLQNAVERAKRHFNARKAPYAFALLQQHVEDHRKLAAHAKVGLNEMICDSYCCVADDSAAADELTDRIKDRAAGERDELPHCAAAVEKCQNTADALEAQLQRAVQCLDDVDDAVVHEVMRTYECKIVTSAFADYYERLRDVQEIIEKHLETAKPNSSMLLRTNAEQQQQTKQDLLLARFRSATGSEQEVSDSAKPPKSNAVASSSNDIETIEMDIADDLLSTSIPQSAMSRSSNNSLASIQSAAADPNMLINTISTFDAAAAATSFLAAGRHQPYMSASSSSVSSSSLQQQPQVLSATFGANFFPVSNTVLQAGVYPQRAQQLPFASSLPSNIHMQQQQHPQMLQQLLPNFVGLRGMSLVAAAAGGSVENIGIVGNFRRPLLVTPSATMSTVFQQPQQHILPLQQNRPSLSSTINPFGVAQSVVVSAQQQAESSLLFSVDANRLSALEQQNLNFAPTTSPFAPQQPPPTTPLSTSDACSRAAVALEPATLADEANAFIHDNLLPRDPRSRPQQQQQAARPPPRTSGSAENSSLSPRTAAAAAAAQNTSPNYVDSKSGVDDRDVKKKQDNNNNNNNNNNSSSSRINSSRSSSKRDKKADPHRDEADHGRMMMKTESFLQGADHYRGRRERTNSSSERRARLDRKDDNNEYERQSSSSDNKRRRHTTPPSPLQRSFYHAGDDRSSDKEGSVSRSHHRHADRGSSGSKYRSEESSRRAYRHSDNTQYSSKLDDVVEADSNGSSRLTRDRDSEKARTNNSLRTPTVCGDSGRPDILLKSAINILLPPLPPPSKALSTLAVPPVGEDDKTAADVRTDSDAARHRREERERRLSNSQLSSSRTSSTVKQQRHRRSPAPETLQRESKSELKKTMQDLSPYGGEQINTHITLKNDRAYDEERHRHVEYRRLSTSSNQSSSKSKHRNSDALLADSGGGSSSRSTQQLKPVLMSTVTVCGEATP